MGLSPAERQSVLAIVGELITLSSILLAMSDARWLNRLIILPVPYLKIGG
jgi:hypothetical protein